MSKFKCPVEPGEFTARVFLLHACALPDPPRDCLEVVQKAKQKGVYIPVVGNDNRYVYQEMARRYGVKSGKKRSELALDVLEAYFAGGREGRKEYPPLAAPNVLKASYEIDKKFSERRVEMTGDQIAFALCGLLFTTTGVAKLPGGVWGHFHLLSGLAKEEVVVSDLYRHQLQQAMALPQDVGVAVKRLYLSAAGPENFTPVELVMAGRQNRVDVIYVNRIYLYDLTSYDHLRKSLLNTARYLYSDEVKRIAELAASRVQMFFASMQEVRGRRCGDPRWLYDALRELHRYRDEDGVVGRYASEMYGGLTDLLSGACI